MIDLSVISSINKKINSPLSLADLLTSIMDVAKYLLNAEGSSLLLSEKGTGDLIFNIVIGDKGGVIKGEKVPKGMGIAGTVAQTYQPVIVNDVTVDPRFFNEIDKKSQFITRNIIGVPMAVMGEFVGVLEIVNTIGRDSFDEWDLEKAMYIADQAAVAIHNRQLYDELTKRIDEITSLYEVSQSISFSGKDDDILQNILLSLSQSIDVERASITLFNEEENKLLIEASIGIPDSLKNNYSINMNNTVSGHVFRTGDPMIVADINAEMPDNLRSYDRNYKTGSFISIPIMHKTKTLGILSLSDKKNGNYFDSFDLRVLSTVSSQIAEIYQNKKNQRVIDDRQRLAREIDIAAEIQQKILPAIPGTFNKHRLAAFNRPAKEIGGDFFDFFRFDSNKYAVLVADVSGKGIPAALFMGTARNVVRAETRIDRSPARLLQNANTLIHQDSESGMFVTLFYAVIDSHNSIITYGSAGHNSQFIIKSKTKDIVRLSAKGRPLGLLDNQEYEERVQIFESGDILVLFTDGVLECLSDESLDIDIGEKRLIDIALQYTEKEPSEFIDNLKKEMSKNSLDNDVIDDFTAFIIKF